MNQELLYVEKSSSIKFTPKINECRIQDSAQGSVTMVWADGLSRPSLGVQTLCIFNLPENPHGMVQIWQGRSTLCRAIKITHLGQKKAVDNISYTVPKLNRFFTCFSLHIYVIHALEPFAVESFEMICENRE